MISGLLGVPAGSYLAQWLRPRYSRIDAHICGGALLISSPLVFVVLLTASYSSAICYTFVFFAEFFLNLTWSIVADMLLVRFKKWAINDVAVGLIDREASEFVHCSSFRTSLCQFLPFRVILLKHPLLRNPL